MTRHSAGNLQQKVPSLRVGYVADRGEIGNDGVRNRTACYDQKALRPGEALEFDAERAAHVAARAVGADQPAAATGVSRPPVARLRPSTPHASCVTPLTALSNAISKSRIVAQLRRTGCG